MLIPKQQILMKREAVAGTPEGLAGSNAIRYFDEADFDPEPILTPRSSMSVSMTKRGSVMGGRAGRLKFKSYLSGTATAPVQTSNEMELSTALHAAGLLGTFSGTTPNEQASYKPDKDFISDETTGPYTTVRFMLDGKTIVMVGSCANAILHYENGKPPWGDFDFLGKWTTAGGDLGFFSASHSTVAPPPFNGTTMVIDGVAVRISSLTLDLGNELALRDSPNDGGYFTAQIVDRAPKGTIDPEEVLAATKDFWLLYVNQTKFAIDTGVFPSTTWGGVNYNQFQLKINAAQLTKLKWANRNKLVVDAMEFDACGTNDNTHDTDIELIQT